MNTPLGEVRKYRCDNYLCICEFRASGFHMVKALLCSDNMVELVINIDEWRKLPLELIF
jgi:hypothetical protein